MMLWQHKYIFFYKKLRKQHKDVEEAEATEKSGAISDIQINDEKNERPERYSSRAQVCCKFFSSVTEKENEKFRHKLIWSEKAQYQTCNE